MSEDDDLDGGPLDRFEAIDAELRLLTQLVGQVLERLPERDK